MPLSLTFGDTRSTSSVEQTPWSAPNFRFNGWSENKEHGSYRSVSWSYDIHYFSNEYLDEEGNIIE